MDGVGMQCHGCGSTNVVFDSKRRILKCNQCGKEEYYSRATLNANGRVVFGKQNAMSFFTEGKYEESRHYAMEVLDISMDNAPALYILSYVDEFITGKAGAMQTFFKQIKDIPLEYDEVKDLRELIWSSAYRLSDYEKDIIELIALNMQSPEDLPELTEFMDKICPYFISKRVSADYLDKELADMYKELADHCGIPKTCFALIKSISENPDSPIAGNSFFLKAKAKYFYDNYVLVIGTIIESMKDNEFKQKFMGAYAQKQKQFLEQLN
ncbi:hypothetical protein [Butyrivibrio sp. INlla18]|uniref:hypothetical protein n=1 Tax=Butyrivibrio sp. INlla18 TaxID=1520806 RepID=UPI000B841FDF|nr:hypothetical protein [Butyrivibrio sp. INlla18]